MIQDVPTSTHQCVDIGVPNHLIYYNPPSIIYLHNLIMIILVCIMRAKNGLQF
jgi:hypothetical protein